MLTTIFKRKIGKMPQNKGNQDRGEIICSSNYKYVSAKVITYL